MNILEFIKTRRSIRKFLDQPVEKEHLDTILEAARWAPSAGNCQPWRFVVVTDSQKIKKFDPFFHQPWVISAPAVIVVLANPEDSRRRYGPTSEWFVQDCAAASQNMLLMAHGLGLGAVWIGAFGKEAVRETLEIPSQLEVLGLICVGHYKHEGKVSLDGYVFSNNDRRNRKALERIAFDDDLNTPWSLK